MSRGGSHIDIYLYEDSHSIYPTDTWWYNWNIAYVIVKQQSIDLNQEIYIYWDLFLVLEYIYNLWKGPGCTG
jgi:hypothetical protein